MFAGIQLLAIDEIITDGFRSFVRVYCDLLCVHNIYVAYTNGCTDQDVCDRRHTVRSDEMCEPK